MRDCLIGVCEIQTEIADGDTGTIDDAVLTRCQDNEVAVVSEGDSAESVLDNVLRDFENGTIDGDEWDGLTVVRQGVCGVRVFRSDEYGQSLCTTQERGTHCLPGFSFRADGECFRVTVDPQFSEGGFSCGGSRQVRSRTDLGYTAVICLEEESRVIAICIEGNFSCLKVCAGRTLPKQT